ncbi:MAG: AAA family ATPase [Candidatus Electrothrix sp. AUS4]|nr:AAA family ATPase [Candidatus Electrothrix sp. AUS4]
MFSSACNALVFHLFSLYLEKRKKWKTRALQAEDLAVKNRVVVLIDEYDKPILNHIANTEKAVAIRDDLRNFFAILKAQDANLRFVFLTGVSRFSRVSVFSDINHLSDLSLARDYTTLLGYTQDELETFFAGWIDRTAAELGQERPDVLEAIRNWYNGYCFHQNGERVYNPFSCLQLFDFAEFRNWWFETATPAFLVNLIRKNRYDVSSLEGKRVGINALSTFDVEQLDIVALLLQAGYLTIREYHPERRLYTLDYPNREVRESFLTHLAEILSGNESGTMIDDLWRLHDALDRNDPEHFFIILSSVFAAIPYAVRELSEQYYQSIFYLLFRLMSLNVQAEVHIATGRVDAVLELASGVWIFEFKFDRSADEALQQIHEKGYAAPWLGDVRPLHLVGVNFDSAKRNIGEWKVEIPLRPGSTEKN